MSATNAIPESVTPILLYDGGCAVCRRIGQWVSASGSGDDGRPSIIAEPVGDDPVALHRLNATLDIWDAYAVVHVVMPDGSMKIGGEAIAEVLRRLPGTRWLAGCLTISVFGVRPFQMLLNVGYTLLDDVRPLFGCDSCGRPRPWVRPLQRLTGWAKSLRGHPQTQKSGLHFRPLAAGRHVMAQGVSVPNPMSK